MVGRSGPGRLVRRTCQKAGAGIRPHTYGELCVKTALAFRALFRLQLRATEGFMGSLLRLSGMGELEVPHYCTLSRRAGGLKIEISKKAESRGVTDIAVDSTGLKSYGEGEWKTRIHGKGKRRTWRKHHVAMNPDNGMGARVEFTLATVHDDQMMSALLSGLTGVGNVYADGAYVSKGCFNAIAKTGGRARVALRTGTALAEARGDPGLEERNRLVREIWFEGRGKYDWTWESDSHRRSLAENHMPPYNYDIRSPAFKQKIQEPGVGGRS